jgi:hypothetical protein
MNKLGLVLFLVLFVSPAAFSWGGRGHLSICDAATHLVQSKELRIFLTRRSHMIDHLCNVPDIYWRDLGKVAESGAPTHYFEPDLVGADIKNVPIDFKEASKMLSVLPSTEHKSPVKSVADEIGSLWWRADQFARLAVAAGKKSKAFAPPKDKTEEQIRELPYNESVFEFIQNMGLIGHFVGDVSQPLHNISDYDGYKTGHGGLHNYYEETVVSAIDENLISKIAKEARANTKTYTFLREPDVVSQMKSMAIIALSEYDKIVKLDTVLNPSILDASGPLTKKVIAQRRPPEDNVGKYEKTIIGQMARSAALLAHIWDECYEKSGKPDLSHYQSYRFPIEPEFVPPDYL